MVKICEWFFIRKWRKTIDFLLMKCYSDKKNVMVSIAVFLYFYISQACILFLDRHKQAVCLDSCCKWGVKKREHETCRFLNPLLFKSFRFDKQAKNRFFVFRGGNVSILWTNPKRWKERKLLATLKWKEGKIYEQKVQTANQRDSDCYDGNWNDAF